MSSLRAVRLVQRTRPSQEAYNVLLRLRSNDVSKHSRTPLVESSPTSSLLRSYPAAARCPKVSPREPAEPARGWTARCPRRRARGPPEGSNRRCSGLLYGLLSKCNYDVLFGPDSELPKDMFQVLIDLERQVRKYIKFGGEQAQIHVPLMESLPLFVYGVTLYQIRLSSCPIGLSALGWCWEQSRVVWL